MYCFVVKKPFLPGVWGWIILIGLVVLDASLDFIFAEGKGLESPIWKPMANLLGVNNPILLTPFVLLTFFIVVKIVSFLEQKIEMVPNAEELVLTILVIVYAVFDLWLIMAYLFDFRLFKSHLYLIPLLIVIGIAYGWWAENKLKKK
jgi:hypothetical protein